MSDLRDKVIFNDFVIILPKDTNKDEVEFLQRDRRSKEEDSFMRGEVINCSDSVLSFGLEKGKDVLFRKSGSQQLRHNGITYAVVYLRDVILIY